MQEQEKNAKLFVLIICSIFIIVITALFSSKLLLSKARTTNVNSGKYVFEKNQNPVNINKILTENTSTQIEQEMVAEEICLEYTTEYRNNSELPSGTIQVLQEGRDGKQNAIIIKKYIDGELISEELVAETLTKASINKIVEIGTGAGVNNYKPKARGYGICYFKSSCRKDRT